MRVFAMLAAASLMSAAVQAEEVLTGRNLHGGDKADSRSKYYTDRFIMMSDSHGPAADFEGMYLYGCIIGFSATAIFMIFALTMIIQDEL